MEWQEPAMVSLSDLTAPIRGRSLAGDIRKLFSRCRTSPDTRRLAVNISNLFSRCLMSPGSRSLVVDISNLYGRCCMSPASRLMSTPFARCPLLIPSSWTSR
eukprot:jgi/Botrbrau1/14545/Bobra.0170s0002.2